jgi:putative DNA methylase
MTEKRPKLLIEEWIPAAAIGVECMRERSTGQQPPDKRLHVWWARRPLCVSRAAVLASLLPADFPRNIFERLLGFWGSSEQIIDAQKILDDAKLSGFKVDNPHGERAFKRPIPSADLEKAHQSAAKIWGDGIVVIDPMAGGGSIPLESARLGFCTLANEYNPVACSILEATVDYPFRFGEELARRSRFWGQELRKRFNIRMQKFYPKTGVLPPLCYLFARTVPDPDHPGWHTPLVPDWHLVKPKGEEGHVVAEPIVDKQAGTWKIRVREVGKRAGQLREIPRPTYSGGKGISIFTGNQIPADYIKAKAQAGEMKSALYAIAVKTPQGLRFHPPEEPDLRALEEAEKELEKVKESWEKKNIIPTEQYPKVSSDERPRLYGMPNWSDMFSPRQLLAMGTLVEELQNLRPEIIKTEGKDLGEAIIHLLAFVVDKFAAYNGIRSRWHSGSEVIAPAFDRHDFSFKPAFSEMAPCDSGSGLDWAIDNVCEAYEEISDFSKHSNAKPVEISLGSATNLAHISDKSITAVIVDPPYADNVQYSELADFFYVWLKRTQGHRRPEWFSTYLCERDQEAVVNISRHRNSTGKTKDAKAKAYAFYKNLMTECFKEFRRILRDDGVLTVMFTHKKQDAWEMLFESLIQAGFSITATWPIKTESEHSLHQARKNAAQSTVILVARKRPADAGISYFDSGMKEEIRTKARQTAERLQQEALNRVDQLVGSFGPAMEVYSRFDSVKTDTGVLVPVGRAIDEASDAVSSWRIEQLAARGLDGVEPEGKFYLLCWDVLGAAEFRFNEAKLLGHAVGMDVDDLLAAGLIEKSGEKVRIIPVLKRRRPKALEQEEIEQTLFGPIKREKKHRKKDVLKIHPNDPVFRTALDGCHALALRFLEAGSQAGGIGSAKALIRQQRWTKDSAVAKLMEALVRATPEALKFEEGKKSAAAEYPEFRAWHALLEPLFGIKPPEWKKKEMAQARLFAREEMEEELEEEEVEEETDK